MSLAKRIFNKLRKFAVYPQYRRYRAAIGPQHPLYGITTRLVADARGDPTEFFDHYAAFAYWTAAKVAARATPLRILDLGSPKMFNGMLSATHEVTSMVLADCRDTISRVRYVRHDVSDPLPFPEGSFDAFTSTVSLPLIGLGRYGDRVNTQCLPALVRELRRILSADGELFVSMCLGPNVLNFSNGWFLDLPTIERVLEGFSIVDCLVDRLSSPRGRTGGAQERFVADTSVAGMPVGDYRVVFLHCRRAAARADRAY